eukprot:1151639-Pelagomonas_calceolata.AAC.6
MSDRSSCTFPGCMTSAVAMTSGGAGLPKRETTPKQQFTQDLLLLAALSIWHSLSKLPVNLLVFLCAVLKWTNSLQVRFDCVLAPETSPSVDVLSRDTSCHPPTLAFGALSEGICAVWPFSMCPV